MMDTANRMGPRFEQDQVMAGVARFNRLTNVPHGYECEFTNVRIERVIANNWEYEQLASVLGKTVDPKEDRFTRWEDYCTRYCFPYGLRWFESFLWKPDKIRVLVIMVRHKPDDPWTDPKTRERIWQTYTAVLQEKHSDQMQNTQHDPIDHFIMLEILEPLAKAQQVIKEDFREELLSSLRQLTTIEPQPTTWFDHDDPELDLKWDKEDMFVTRNRGTLLFAAHAKPNSSYVVAFWYSPEVCTPVRYDVNGKKMLDETPVVYVQRRLEERAQTGEE